MAEYGLLGEKLSHSFSPQIHAQLADYDYQLISLPPEKLAGFLREKQFRGLNVTIPYKKAVIPYLDELSPAARRIGAVNTIVNRGGRLFGDNTDYAGLKYAIKRAGICLSGKKVLILGSGGTSKTAHAAAEDLGAREIFTISRSGKHNYQNLSRHADAQIILNTTPVGMFPQNGQAPLGLEQFPHLEGVADAIYNPLKTALLLEAEELGIPHTNGLPMLVAQAKAACEVFLQKSISAEKTEQILSSLERQLKSVVFVGMPGSGKTTVGRLVAEKLGREFIDSDDIIAQSAGKSIPEIFAEEGEPGFRRREQQAIAQLTKRPGIVLSVGGGAILLEENRRALRQNAAVFLLTRDLEKLPLDGRPLSKDPAALRKLAEVRGPLYQAVCDFAVSNNASLSDTLEKVLALLGEEMPK